MKKEKNQSKQVLLSVLAVAVLVVAVVGITFAAFTYTKEGTQENTISTGTIAMTYTEDTNGISITDAMPMTDASGKELSGDGNVFDFTVKTTIAGTTTVNYEVAAMKDAASTLADSEVKLYLEKKSGADYTQVLAPTKYTPLTEVSSVGTPAGAMVLTTSSHTATSTDEYRLRMWVDNDYVVSGTAKTFTVVVSVYAKAV